VRELPERRINLNGKFPCGAQDQDFDGLAPGNGGETLNQRNHERQRLACAGLRGRYHVAALHEWRNGLRLRGPWSHELVLFEVGPRCHPGLRRRKAGANWNAPRMLYGKAARICNATGRGAAMNRAFASIILEPGANSRSLAMPAATGTRLNKINTPGMKMRTAARVVSQSFGWFGEA